MSKPVVLLADGDLVALPGSADGDVLKWNATTGEWYAASGGGTGTVTSVTAGAGLNGGVITSTGTISMPNVGTAGTVGNVAQTPSISTDAQGRVTGVTLANIQIAQSQVDNLTTDLGGKVSTSTQVIAGTGLSGGGALSGNVTLSLGTVGTAQTALGSASKTVTVTTDAYGRVTSLSEQSIAIAGSQITSGTVALANGGTGKDLSGITGGEVIVGQTGGGSVDAVTISKDATLGADGALTVVGLQGRALSSSAPIPGQSLVWSSAGGGAWVPGDTASGGSGGGGVVYFMNAGTSRTGGGLPAGSYQLGRTAETSSNPITYTNVPTSAWTRVAGFVTDAGDPAIGTLPAGIWDFNVYATSTANANDMLFRLSFYEYDGAMDPELGSPIATTLSTAIYDPSVAVQYQATFNIPQTTFTGKRIYLKLEAFTSVASKNVTFDFGNSFASHVHTTVPSVTGSGFVKVLNDVIVSTGQLVNLADSTDVGSSILGVGNGGTGAASLPQHQVLVGNGTSAVTSYALTNGQVLIGQTGGAPAAATLTAGTGVGITNGTNSITVAIGQAVGTGDSPTFAGLTLSGLTGYLSGNGGSALTASATIPVADVSGAAPLASPTFTGKVTLPVSTTSSAGLSFGTSLGSAPTAPVNGDMWVQSDGRVYIRLNNTSQNFIINQYAQDISLAPAPRASITGFNLTFTGGQTNGTVGGAVTIAGGAGISGGGAVTIRGGTGSTNGAVNIGQTNTSAVNIGATGVTTAIAGTATATTVSAGDNSTNVATTAFVTAAVAAAASTPYDLPLEIPGTPPLSTKVVNFASVRAFILSTTGHQGGQLTNPSGNFVCTVRKNATTLGTITFAAGGFSSNITATLADRTFAAGDVLSVETQASALGIDTPFATLLMTLV